MRRPLSSRSPLLKGIRGSANSGSILHPDFTVDGLAGSHGSLDLPDYVIEGIVINRGSGSIIVPDYSVNSQTGSTGALDYPSFIVESYSINISDGALDYPSFVIEATAALINHCDGEIIFPDSLINGLTGSLGLVNHPDFVIDSLMGSLGSLDFPDYLIEGVGRQLTYSNIDYPDFDILGYDYSHFITGITNLRLKRNRLSTRVLLYLRSTGELIAETVSDPVTGEFAFYMNNSSEHYVVALDAVDPPDCDSMIIDKIVPVSHP